MTPLNKILCPYLLVENYHLNFFNIEYNDETLLDFVNLMKKISTSDYITNIAISQEPTEYQKSLLKSCFPNLKHYIKH